MSGGQSGRGPGPVRVGGVGGVGGVGPHVLREYALLADGERGILVGPRGELAWMCFPRCDSDALLSDLLGGQGSYAVTPHGRVGWGGSYEHGSLVWRSRWITEGGIVECHEALAYPGDPERATVLRHLVAVEGDHRGDVRLDPRGGFGAQPLVEVRRRDEAWTARTGDVHLRWTGAPTTSARRRAKGTTGLTATVDLAEGETCDLVLELALEPLADRPLPDADTIWHATMAAWRHVVPELSLAHARRDARHAYAVLRGLTGAGGGMVAATTTSLPERAEEGRTYDYRYVWIRDQCFAGRAVAAAVGADPLLEAATGFVAARLLDDGEQLSPAYTVTGEPIPRERSLELPGYPGGGSKVGNQVADQFQLDAFGEALLLFAAAAREDRLDEAGHRAAEVAADAIARRWHEPDAGIWELPPARWAHSRLSCAAGLRAMATVGASRARAAEWLALADRLVADAGQDCVHPSGRWQRAPDDERLDGALLLAAVRGAVPADDPRTRATLEAYMRELTQDGYAYRFRPDERPLGEAEGAFLLCSFILALALDQQGAQAEAARWFERARASCGPPALFSEEFDVAQRQLRGNLPQAFVHALALECATRLDHIGLPGTG